jgi:folate-binding protein YgfZ
MPLGFAAKLRCELKILRVFGADSRDFLHRVTAGTVKSLKPGEGAGGVLLNGQSRMIAQFDLLCGTGEEFFLVSPAECFAALKAGLEKMHFSENLEMEEKGEAKILENGPLIKRENPFLWNPNGWPSPVPGFQIAFGAGEIPSNWEFQRILHGIPSPKDWDQQTPALEAAMLPWIDRHKGCYPGQEVVELSLNVGKPARALVVWEAKEKIPLGKIALPEGGEALVTSTAEGEGKFVCLARVPWKKKDLPAAGFVLR